MPTTLTPAQLNAAQTRFEELKLENPERHKEPMLLKRVAVEQSLPPRALFNSFVQEGIISIRSRPNTNPNTGGGEAPTESLTDSQKRLIRVIRNAGLDVKKNLIEQIPDNAVVYIKNLLKQLSGVNED